ncbi:alpha/beta hydrolase [Nocardioides sp. JQ2195]|uniref:alpha/beta fold hydrolase n=1 Tax=Nocardioides sp. JQ2195 TaxID=2592334 RepID=UPI00143E6DBB|nr:alpha/beta hydrolase [Nocardioides sp. JQ2195]QIX26103.1 alpha/beta hydrolase [Nocardioides sp. JQ2195]
MDALAPPESIVNDTDASVFFFDVESSDGTMLRAWTNDPDCLIDGPTVVLCNGLGTNPWTTPSLVRPGSGVRVVSWNHRGTGGSARPADRKHVRIEDFVEDALAVMDHVGLDKAVLLGWSMGVNTMFELAVRHPERVSGLFAYAGVPGETFSTMLAPFRLPKPVARALTVNLTRAVAMTGRAITPITSRLPIGPRAINLISHSGFMFPVADPDLAIRAIREYLTTPVDWYFHLALTTSAHGRVSLSRITVPTAFVGAKWDLLAGPKDMATAAERIEGATYVELDGSHFIAMEQPERFHELLLEFLAKVS